MPHYVGLDVALAETKICILDNHGAIALEATAASEPATIAGILRRRGWRYRRVVLETGPTFQWMFKGLAKAGFPVTCIDSRHASAVLKTRLNKTDRNDAHGLAELALHGHFKPVHVKTDESLRGRMLLTARRAALAKLVDLELSIRGQLQTFGWKLAPGSRHTFEARARDLARRDAFVISILEPMFAVRAQLREAIAGYDRAIIEAVEADPVCRRLRTAPGVGALVALTYRCAVDIPERFARSRDVAAHFGLTPRTHQTGISESRRRISKCGDMEARRALFAAARAMLPPHRRPCALQAWGQQVRARAGGMKAMTAVARRLAVILHRMWIEETEFRWDEPATR